MKYRRTESPNSVLTARLNSPNDELEVVEKGTYELMGVRFSAHQSSIAVLTQIAGERCDVPRVRCRRLVDLQGELDTAPISQACGEHAGNVRTIQLLAYSATCVRGRR